MSETLVRVSSYRKGGREYFKVVVRVAPGEAGRKPVYQHEGVPFGTREHAEQLAAIIRNRYAKQCKGDMAAAVAPYLPGARKPNLILPLMREYLQRMTARTGKKLAPYSVKHFAKWLPDEDATEPQPRRHFGWWAGKGLYDVDKLNVDRFAAYLEHDRELATNSRRCIFTELGRFLAWCEALEIVPKGTFPEMPRIKPQRKRPKILTPAEQRRVLNEIPLEQRGIFLLCARYGVRPGAARALTMGDLHRGWITVSKAVKGGEADAEVGETKAGKENRVPLTKELRAWLNEFARDRLPTARMFTNPRAHRDTRGQLWAHSSIYLVWKTACEAAGVPPTSLYNGTKHSAATRFFAEGHSYDAIGGLIQVGRDMVPTYAAMADEIRLRLIPEAELDPEALQVRAEYSSREAESDRE